MLKLEYTNQFKRDLKLSKKRGKNLKKLEPIVELLLKKKPLPEKNKDHDLTGNYKDHRECHIEPDWLLIYLQGEAVLVLVRTGTHSDLFN
jgi:mRNA interferase YafQ